MKDFIVLVSFLVIFYIIVWTIILYIEHVYKRRKIKETNRNSVYLKEKLPIIVAGITIYIDQESKKRREGGKGERIVYREKSERISWAVCQ